MKKIKNIITQILIGTLLLSCKGKMTNIKLTPIENDKKWNFYYIGYRQSFSDSKAPVDSLYVFKPTSFRLENNTGRDLKINRISDGFYPFMDSDVIVNNGAYEYGTPSIKINSRETVDITVFLHLPISINAMDKEYKEKLTIDKDRIKSDSIVLDKISSRMQDAIDSSFKKEHISINLLNKNNTKEDIVVLYCTYRQKVMVYDADSLYRANPTFKPDCN